MLTYGGIRLPTPQQAVADQLERHLSRQAVFEFLRPTAPVPERHRPFRLNTLWWPTGASRWAEGHFLVHTSALAQIRQLAYSTASANRYQALPLVMTHVGYDGIGFSTAYTVSTDLFMLPARPIADIANLPDSLSGLWLLTLVDQRYFFWEKSAAITVTGGTTTWANLFTSIGSALGVTIATDTISADYLKPAADLSSQYEYLPPLLDAACRSVGHRLVCNLDGTIETQSAATAKADQDTQWGTWVRRSGGRFAFHETSAPQDVGGLVPATVRVVFPRTDNGTPATTVHTDTATLTGLALSQYPAEAVGHDGVKVLVSTATATYAGGGSPTNDTELSTLTDRMATDWYLWQLARNDVEYAGIVPYAPEGMSDFVEWTYRADQAGCRIVRGPWNGLSEMYFHHGTGGSLTECCPGVFWDGTTVKIPTHTVTTSSDTVTVTDLLEGDSITVNFSDSTTTFTGGSITYDSVTFNVDDSTTTFTSGTVDFSSTVFTSTTSTITYDSTNTLDFNFGSSTTTTTAPGSEFKLPNLTTSGEPGWSHEAGNLIINGADNTLWYDDGTDFIPFVSNAEGSTTVGSTTQNNYSLDGVTTLYSTGAGGNTWTGFDNPYPGKEVLFVNQTGSDETIAHQTGSTATNQITTPSGSNLTVPTGKTVRFIYDGTTQKYVVVGGTALGGGFDLITESGGSSVTIDAPGGTVIEGGLTLGTASDTVSNNLQILDGGANEPGLLTLYDASGNTHYYWTDTNGNLRKSTTAPTDEDADGVVIGGAGVGWVKYTIAYDDVDIDVASSTATKTIHTLAAQDLVTRMVVKHSAQWTGSGLSNLEIDILIDSVQYIEDHSIGTTPSDSGYYAWPPGQFGVGESAAFAVFDYTGGDDVDIRISCTGGTLDALTAGSVDVWLKIETLP